MEPADPLPEDDVVPSRLELDPAIDVAAHAASFAATGRARIPDVLTHESAVGLAKLLEEETPWGLVWQCGSADPTVLRAEQAARLSKAQRGEADASLAQARRVGDYAFRYRTYPLVTAYLERWAPDSPLARLLEEINAPPFLDLLRRVSGHHEIVKADGQATLYEPGDFLSRHDDREDSRGRKVAYVLSLTTAEWLPEWGGYLQFFDDELNVTEALRPRFNTLSLFRVPQLHSVSQVSAEAPRARFAVTGWGRHR